MSASYPGSVKTFTSRNNGDVIQASHINDLQDEVNAIEAGLLQGSAPLNSSNSTVAALSVLGGSTFTGPVVFSTGVTFAATTVPRCNAFSTATQSIPNNSYTAVTFEGEDFDSGSLHSTSVNTSRFTIPAGSSGTYVAYASVNFGVNSSGQRILKLRKNGSSDLFGSAIICGNPSATFTESVQTQGIVVLDATDYVECYAFQNTGGSLNIGSTSLPEIGSRMYVMKVL